MRREDFVNLPLKLALEVIWALAWQKLERMDAPNVPRPPRYDGRLARAGGFVWMSELNEESLNWWLVKKREGAEQGGQYAERDGKLADQLANWLAWRTLFPAECWSGTRGKDRVTAEPPSREPKLQQWGPKKTEKPAERPQEDDDLRF